MLQIFILLSVIVIFLYLLGMKDEYDFIHQRMDRLEMAIKNQYETLEKLEKSIAQSCEKDDADGKSI